MPSFTHLEYAVREGSLSKLKRLYNLETLWGKLSSDVADRKGIRGCTLLHHACRKGHYEIVLHLVENMKVNIDSSNDAGERPIHCASYGGHARIVRFLLFSGALKQRVYDSTGQTPLHLAAAQGHLATVMLLVQEDPKSIRIKSHSGATALHGACYNGDVEVVRYLVEAGKANVNVRRSDGKTPLHLACQKNHLDVVMFLVETCLADVHAQSVRRETPLHVASRGGCLEVVQYLTIHGKAKVNVLDSFYMIPLHGAISKGHVEVASFLLPFGVPDDVVVVPRSHEGEFRSTARPEDPSRSLELAKEKRQDEHTRQETIEVAKDPCDKRCCESDMEGSIKQSEHDPHRLLQPQLPGLKDLTPGYEELSTNLDRVEKTCGLSPEYDAVYEPVYGPEMSAEDRAYVSAIVGTAEDDDETMWSNHMPSRSEGNGVSVQ